MVGVVGRGTNLLSNNKILSPYYSLYMSYYKKVQSYTGCTLIQIDDVLLRFCEAPLLYFCFRLIYAYNGKSRQDVF